ncbi:MAG: M28 family peptidase [Pirellulales bacterium]
MKRPDGQTVFLGAVILSGIATLVYLAFFSGNGHAGSQLGRGKLRDSPVDAKRSFRYLQAVCDIGPRPAGSDGMKAQQKLLTAHFEKLGGRVRLQPFTGRHPLDGTQVAMANLIVELHPDRPNRIMLCAHYDTRPFPDRDPRRPRGRFIGANDGGSGVAVLMELAHHLPQLESPYGIDLVLFDAEELVFEDRQGTYFLGSEHFARDYAANPPAHRYAAAVLLDMVGDAQLQLFQERNSVSWPDSRPLVEEIWGVAKELGVTEFIARPKHEIRDDHLALHDIARIPAIDIIDFDYPRSSSASYWHTEADTPDKCSGESLAKVGAVLLEWLRRKE